MNAMTESPTTPTPPEDHRPVRAHPFRLVTLLVAVAFVAAACSSTDSPATPASGTSTPGSVIDGVTGTITVSAAASLKAPFTTMGADFERTHPGVDVVFNFDSSSTLAKQIIDGAPADGFASADEANMKKLSDGNLIDGPAVTFARNRLTIVVKAGNPAGIRTLADLATGGTISLCGAEVPCGRYADQILATAGVTIPADRITRGQNATSTLAAVAEGDADAGIVYVSDVTGTKVEAVGIPDAQNVTATYPIGVVKGSSHFATMVAFVAYVLSEPGQATLAAAGFLPPA